MKTVTVFYEDRLDARSNNFGPHILALACVSDALPDRPDPWVLEKVCKGVPRKGNGNVLKALRQVADEEMGTVLALLDGDRIRDLLDVPASTSDESVLAKAQQLAGHHPVLLLQKNIETIYELGYGILHGRPPPSEKPSPTQRDKVFQNLAGRRPEDRALLSESNASWRVFIETLSGMIRRAGAR